jgi:hypothetical protein
VSREEDRRAKAGGVSQTSGSWAIEIPARRRITLELTEAQQEMLRRATKHVVPSVTLVLSSNTLEPNGHALACLELGSARRARAKRRRAR